MRGAVRLGRGMINSRKIGASMAGRDGRWWRSTGSLVVAFAISASVAASAQTFERVEIPPTTEDPFTLVAYLARGVGEGPRGSIVALHGCDGLLTSAGEPGARAKDWVGRWTAAGYTVLMPESFRSRGLGSQCRVPLAERKAQPLVRARDVVRAADWLGSQPNVAPAKMAMIGWSHGGSTVLAAVSAARVAPKVDFKAAIAFYPGCRGYLASERWSPRIPVSILMGAADDWTPAAPCRELAAKHKFSITEYPDAYHGFDAPDVTVRELKGLAITERGDGTAHVGTDPAARAAAIDDVARILAAALK